MPPALPPQYFAASTSLNERPTTVLKSPVSAVDPQGRSPHKGPFGVCRNRARQHSRCVPQVDRLADRPAHVRRLPAAAAGAVRDQLLRDVLGPGTHLVRGTKRRGLDPATVSCLRRPTGVSEPVARHHVTANQRAEPTRDVTTTTSVARTLTVARVRAPEQRSDRQHDARREGDGDCRDHPARQLGSRARGDGSLHRAIPHRASDDVHHRAQAVADPSCDEPLVGGMTHHADEAAGGSFQHADRDA